MWRELWYFICTTCRPHKSVTVRYAFPLVAIAAAFAGTLAAVVSEDVSYLDISADPATVRAGETVFITVTAGAHTPVNAIDVQLDFPEEQLEIKSIDTGESVITLWTEEPYAEDGTVYLRGGTFRQGFVGEHQIARIRANAIQSGSATVRVASAEFVAGDGTGSPVDLTDRDEGARIYVTNEDGTLVGNASVELLTDIDGSGGVDLADISVFMAAWFDEDTRFFDFNDDGDMNFRDFSIILADSFFN